MNLEVVINLYWLRRRVERLLHKSNMNLEVVINLYYKSNMNLEVLL